MNFLNDLISPYAGTVIIALIFLVILQFILISKLFSRTKKTSRKLDLDNIDGETLIQEIEGLDNKIESVYEYSKSINSKADGLNNELKKSLKNIGIERFDAFGDGGGDHSFSVAVLDDHKNGIIIKSIYAREATRVYAVPVQDGESMKELPQEDQNSIKNACK